MLYIKRVVRIEGIIQIILQQLNKKGNSTYGRSYFVGGFIIGVISPKIRILEPAIGAFLSIFLVVLVKKRFNLLLMM